MMTKIGFNDVLKLAKRANANKALRSIVFDGKSAITATEINWIVGVPCAQPALTEPVVVPVDAVLAHLAKSRHLIVTPDGLTNGQGLVTPFGRDPKVLWDTVLDMMPSAPKQDSVSFDLELDALDRVLVASGVHDIRYYLNGVLMDLTNGVLAGCDGHRLHLYRNRVPMAFKRKLKDGAPVSAPVEVIVNRAPLDWIVGSQSEVAKVTIWNPQRQKDGEELARTSALIQTEDAFVWVRSAVEGKYPDWNRVLPAVAQRPVVFGMDPVQVADAAAGMGRVAMLRSGNKWAGVRLDFGAGCMSISGADDSMPLATELREGREAVAGDDSLWMGINASYLQDLADCVTKAAQWRPDPVNTKNCALLVVDGDFSGVVMPTREEEPKKPGKPTQGPETGQDAPHGPETGQDAPHGPETGQDAPHGPETGQDAPQGPETGQDAPCPAAVASLAAQLVRDAQTGRKTPRKAGKARKAAKSEPVPA